ncbi:triose-phosphate isomerase [Alicyclobacillus acidocaldarius]|uniref:Triosephosphate isomerase n=1 Tax=Alicyclobacillus acidocaldarius (strain Tc-4-1) TaxID=1048834 RepID=F8IEF8_ALIAT|nr:triose-phosphate isomerase [Alicyclobacillus acidocaldarius]AEJ42672.1 Triose-phosphate isomerase [Alicyclobacillus acidocaldarius subsp. acidocaldarius Tc-4-1]
MARTPLLMGNWKMYKTVAEARAFAEALGQQSQKLDRRVEYAICAPYTCLHVLRVMLPAQVRLGAQNVFPEKEGAYTGEIAPGMLAEFGTKYVLAGHSERRMLFGESDQFINQKVKAIVANGMTPVLCVGENSSQKEDGVTKEVVTGQVLQGLDGLSADEVASAVVAYEPVWAIGSGKTATPEDAQEVARAIRAAVAETWSDQAAEGLRILYGGSVKPENVASFVREPDLDGALVGGASLDPVSFAAMAEAIKEVLA